MLVDGGTNSTSINPARFISSETGFKGPRGHPGVGIDS